MYGYGEWDIKLMAQRVSHFHVHNLYSLTFIALNDNKFYIAKEMDG